MAEVADLQEQVRQLKNELTRKNQQHVPQIQILQQILLPGPLNIKSGDISENCKNFKQQWQNYLTASGIDAQNEETKKAILLTAVGQDVFQRYINMPILEKEKATVNELLDAIERNSTPTVNKRYIRAMFNMAKQEQHETYDEYFNKLRGLIKNAQYGQLENDLMLDKIICSIKDQNLRERLWLDENITLNKAIDICRSKEVTEKQLRGIESLPFEVNKIDKRKKHHDSNTQKRLCKFCGYNYHDKIEQCKARKEVCRKCNKKGHYARVCMSKNKNQSDDKMTQSKTRHVKEVTTITKNERSQSNERSKEYVLHTVEADSSTGIFIDLIIYNNNNSCKITCQLDTGATCNIIGKKDLLEIFPDPVMRSTKTTLKTLDGARIMPTGTVQVTLKNRNRKHKLIFYVVETEHCPLLSAQTCQEMELIKIYKSVKVNVENEKAQMIINKYNDVFEGLGKIEGKILLEIDNNMPPRNEAPRRIPISLREQLKVTLDEMEKQNIIVKEYEHTDWTSNLVIVKKNNKLRICIDPKHLNQALKDVKYQLPTIEEVLAELADAKVFTVLDAKHGFWQLELEKNSSKLTTFWTPFGKYRFNRLPFGLKPAMEIFQMKQNQIIAGLKGVVCIADDILVYGKGENQQVAVEDHNKNLEELLKRLKQQNLKINKDKLKVCQQDIKFYGHILTSEGVKPDPNKTSAILNIPRPEDKAETMRFLGLVTYVSKFIPNLATITEPLRNITHMKQKFMWGKAFNNLKQLVTTAPVLQYYNINKPIVIQTDASLYAIGCALLQEKHPIIYASKTLTETQKNYAQIEKEMLAVLFACKRLDQYICGRSDVTIETDHLPVINIFKKPLIKTPKRLQAMILTLQRYNFNIKYKKGTEMYIADTLSRAPKTKKLEKEIEIYNIEKDMKYLDEMDEKENKRISTKTFQKIKQTTAKDGVMKSLINIIKKGWPEQKHYVPEEIKQYWDFRDELIVNDEIVFKGNRVCIPKDIRSDILQKLHLPHLGIESTLKLARETVFWKGITSEIKQMIQNCEVCKQNAKMQKREPMIITDTPTSPFEIISMDVFEMNINNQRKYFLITVDHYSDFFEIDELKDLSAKTTIYLCRKNFSRYGIPVVVITDNGTNFVNTEFKKFAEEWEFEHRTSSPYHQQANGKSEAVVKIAKQLIKKGIESNTDFYKALLIWRNVSNKIGSSSAKQMFCRWLRCHIPNNDTEQEVIRDVSKRIQQQKRYTKQYYDKGTRRENNLKEGDNVYIKVNPNENWIQGNLLQKDTNRTFIVSSKDKHYKRNSLHVMKRNESTEHNITAATDPERDEELMRYERIEEPVDKEKQYARSEQSNRKQDEQQRPSQQDEQHRPRRQARKPKHLEDYETY
ncbi:uncharacterized protein K02A2.6-like [Teleopsis dalmanni]|uniref:uncharacterized protein K02A2.6-like n=1 Tax=Teleopsis dalmanni TaxID=139649 RepID=UPI0018CD68D2|nr:uncharacterized protein K02A2.6-like [Teleopsis dalmanni]